jgi:hypothetical protein
MDRFPGWYLGTEIDAKWWKRYRKNGMFLRGRGEYWFNEQAFYFLRYLTQTPIVLPFSQLQGYETGTWHAGRWAWGMQIVKIIWEHQGTLLYSGFVLPHNKDQLLGLLDTSRKDTDAQKNSFPMKPTT